MNIKTIECFKQEILSYCKQLPYSEYILEKGFIKNTPSLYYVYPFLFLPAFEMEITEKNKKFITLLSISGFLIYRSTIIKDQLFDNDDTEKLNKIGFANYIGAKEICSDTAMKILSKLFAEDSVFWTYWETRKIEFIDGIRLDKNLEYGFVDETCFSDYADKKSALGKLAIDALYVYNECENKTIYKDIIKAHKYFSTTLQLMDDFSDLIQDYRSQQFNWCINILTKKSPNLDFTNEESLKKYFYAKGSAEELLSYAKSTCNLALKIIIPYNCKIWEEILKNQYQEIHIKSFIIQNYINVQKKRNELSRDKSHNVDAFDEQQLLEILNNNFSSTVSKGVTAVLKESMNDFLELKHIIWLPKEDGFRGEDTTYVGDVFQRAILGCFLCELSKNIKSNTFLDSLINRQINLLVSVRRKTMTGGWSYLPQATDIAADADDLGQIIQFFNAANRTDLIDSLCTNPINTLLDNCVTPDGGIKTWIIPKMNKTKDEKHQEFFNKTKWGEGPDIEVHANFLLGLQSLQKAEYKDVIKKGCQFAIANINYDGFWKSRWYYGKYYGTMICANLLKNSQNISSENKKKTDKFILSSQNTDGGWGYKKNISDPLNTSFALLCFSESSDNNCSINKGLKYLKNKQLIDGFWESVNFIRPRAIDPYASKIITTVFVLRALIKYNYRQI